MGRKNNIDQIAMEDIKGKYLIFSIESCLYAMKLSYVYRITSVKRIKPVPFTAPHVLGIISEYNDIWSVIDLRVILGNKNQNSTDYLTGILLRGKNLKACAIVDEILSVTAIDPAKYISLEAKESYILGYIPIDDTIVNFVSIENLLSI